MKFDKLMDGVKKVDWVSIGIAAVGVAGMVLNGKQEKMKEQAINDTIQKKVQEEIEKLV